MKKVGREGLDEEEGEGGRWRRKRGREEDEGRKNRWG